MNDLLQTVIQMGVRETVSSVLVGIGILAILVGALGIVRMPCVFSRSHGVGMIDTAGVGFVVLGLLVHEGLTLVAVKLAFVGIFLFFTSPISTHALVQVAHRNGVRASTGTREGDRRAPKVAEGKRDEKKSGKAGSGGGGKP